MSWTVQDSAELYGLPYWGEPLFDINDEGHLVATPRGRGAGAIDLHKLISDLLDRGIELPVLLRMPQVAERRIKALNRVFTEAIAEEDYQGRYRGVYPIKVNQQRQLVEEVLRAGADCHTGLEAGSKPELLIAMALMEDDNGLIICNGYKDRRYIETALLATKLGRQPILVVEKTSELRLILDIARELDVAPRLGIRAKLSRPGRGRWKLSAGDRAKFGLSAIDIVEMIEHLRSENRLDCLELLHFHIGSQVTAIQSFKRALREATRLYVEMVRLGAPMGLLDVGGGLGVDYDGSRTDFESSRNYTESEYATSVVFAIGAACSSAGIPHPDIVTEAGRATVAHCSILLFDILGVESIPTQGPPVNPRDDDHELLVELREVYDGLTAKNYQESWHDALDVRLRSHDAFALGVLGLEALTRVDRLFWQLCGRLRHIVRDVSYVPDDLDALGPALADTYYGNFSVFQSIPDAWAVGQLFPCLPIHRLDEEPTRRAILADLTCDSDGKLDRFVDRRDVKKVLELHPLRSGERYILAVALVGAYQEILGDMHNLFGDTHAVHVRVDEDGVIHIEQLIEGDSVTRVTSYVQYDRRDLIERVRRATEAAILAGRIDGREAASILGHFRDSLDSYTYLRGE